MQQFYSISFNFRPTASSVSGTRRRPRSDRLPHPLRALQHRLLVALPHQQGRQLNDVLEMKETLENCSARKPGYLKS